MLNVNLIVAIILSILIGAMTYVIHDYINLKSAYKAQEKTIDLLEHTRQATEKAMVDVEYNYQKNFRHQNTAIKQINKDGHLHCCNGHNPQWMLQYQAKGSEDK